MTMGNDEYEMGMMSWIHKIIVKFLTSMIDDSKKFTKESSFELWVFSIVQHETLLCMSSLMIAFRHKENNERIKHWIY